MHEIEVIAAGVPATTQEYLAAMRTSPSELPPLSEFEQLEIERLHLDADTRRRHLEMRRLAKIREERDGQSLGMSLQEMVYSLDSDFTVTSLQRVSGRSTEPDAWFIRMVGDSREVQFSMDLETVHRFLVGSVTNKELEYFRCQIAELIEPRKSMRIER